MNTTKRENKKRVRFVLGEHAEFFRNAVSIYKDVLHANGITRPVPAILVEDETKVKGRVLWHLRSDMLAGFCGPKEGHVYCSNYKVHVRSGHLDYNRILIAFTNDKVGGFDKIIIVNSLHKKLPQLVLTTFCTYDCLYAVWI
jgi:hypothetical protein